MPRIRRSRVVPASPEHVWAIVRDAAHLPRWWPGVVRVEGVTPEHFTQVHATSKGRAVRIDFAVTESRAPVAGSGGLARFEQEIAGSPFERVVSAVVCEIALEPTGGGTEVTISLTQRLRGSSRLGGFLLRRPTAARLEQALANLEAIC